MRRQVGLDHFTAGTLFGCPWCAELRRVPVSRSRGGGSVSLLRGSVASEKVERSKHTKTDTGLTRRVESGISG